MSGPITNPVVRKNRYRPLLIILAAFLLTGCASLIDPESTQEFNSHQVGIINSTASIGQDITSTHHVVSGITLWLSQPDPNNQNKSGSIRIDVSKDAASINPVYSTIISTASIAQYSAVQISLGSLKLPETGSFYVELSSSDSEIIVHGRLEDNYSRGQAYHNREPINADLAFRLTYRYDWNEFARDIKGLILNIKFVLQLAFLLFLPGYALLHLFHLNQNFSYPEQFALSAGLSLALIPIIYLFSSTIGTRVTSLTITGLIIASISIVLAAFLVNRSYRGWFDLVKHPRKGFVDALVPKSILELWGLVIIVIVAFIIRMIMIRDLATSAWVDSSHHGLIARLILNRGSLPETYLPYLDISTSAYHPGFHSSLVAYLELSGMDINTGMLLFGQALNAIVSASVYLLTVTLTQKHASGLIAALITSAFTAMPAYYTSWGRYPQLAGLIILPTAFALIVAMSQSSAKTGRIKLVLGAALAFAGLLLVHYRVTAFMLGLFLSWFLSEFIYTGKNVWRMLRDNCVAFISLGGLTFLLSAPWMIKVIQETIIPRLSPAHSQAPLNFFSDFSWHYLVPIFGKQVISITAIGLLWFFLKKDKITIVISGWIILLFFMANLDALNLPGGSFVNNSSVAIMLFMPFSVVSGHLIDHLFSLWRDILKGVGRLLFTIISVTVLCYFAWLGSRQIISIMNPVTLLSRQADLSALHWIDQNIADDEVILINSFTWGYNLFAGSDGGAWISALAGNPTVPPPVLYGLGSSAAITRLNDLCKEISRLASTPDELWALLHTQQIDYIYIGTRGGAISPASLAANPHYEILYHQDTTWLFHLLP